MKKKDKIYSNRELSWLDFNERVLNEAENPRVPLAERLTFASIYQTNLDEFYMVRVGTLMDQMQSKEVVRDNKTNMTSRDQIKAIVRRTRELDKKKEDIYEQLMGELEPQGIHIINFKRLSNDESMALKTYFDNQIAPFLAPMIIGKQQPFPFLGNKEMYAIFILGTKNGKNKMGIVGCSNKVFKRLIEIPTRPGTFMLSEELILHFAPELFKKYTVKEKTLIRVTRNADIDANGAYDEDMDYRYVMEHLIKKRNKLSPVRLELSRNVSGETVMKICSYIGLRRGHVFVSKVPLDLSFVFQIQNVLYCKPQLFYEKRAPRISPALNMKESILDQIEKKDVLLSYPFEIMKPFLNMLREAATDDSVASIKMTLYRVASRSEVVEALIEAAENGKEVVVLVELRARFDEENNIEMSRRLEDAGCRVIYGLGKYKVHSKLCLISRKTETGISYITQIGTGNYNEKTSRLYTDLSLMTANQNIGRDAAKVFTALMLGETVKEIDYLMVAPHCLQNKVADLIDCEIEHAKNGEPAYIGLKLNSLTDKYLIDKLVEASQAGVKVDMIVRGICCLIPGIPEFTENITIISIVGRFLEHSRIYRFGTPDREKMYIASADFMTRNTIKRVEVAAPIYDEDVKARIAYMFDTMMADDEKGKQQNAAGIYEDRNLGEKKVNSQEIFYQEAYDAVKTISKMEE